ncbi:pyrophosphatase PpaX [Desemzia sp. FAM 23991]|uniref:pyrophosphatase PpaX n=1 Tax=unclassified Desemzia TaxID=2685243 RepID=UPI003887F543
MTIETVLFDFDGTLADSNALINQSHLSVLEEYFPGEYTLDSVRQFNGPSLETTYQFLGAEKSDEMIAKYREYNAVYHDQMIRLFEGVADTLKLLKQKGIRLGVVSTKRNDVLEKGISHLNLEGLFEVVIGAEDYTHFKPNPEPIYTAMAQMNCLHRTTMMVGDNGHDIMAAKNAGIFSVFVGWSQKTAEEIAPFEPDLTVQSMEELADFILKDGVSTLVKEEIN